MQKTVKLCPAVSYYPSMPCAISRILLFIISYACNDCTSMAGTITVFSVLVHLTDVYLMSITETFPQGLSTRFIRYSLSLSLTLGATCM